MCWWWWRHSKCRELPLRCVPGPQPLAAHYQFWPSHLKGLLIFIIFHHFLSPFFFLINVATLERQRWRNAPDFRTFHFDSGSGPRPSAATHLCHNVGVRHIKMICVKFTECWTKSEKLEEVTSEVRKYDQTEPQGVRESAQSTFSLSARCGWNAEWADGGGQALSPSLPPHLPPLAPLLSERHEYEEG